MHRFFRTLWGILTLLAMGWLCYGVYVSTMAYDAAKGTSEAQKAGAALGATLGIGVFVCTGVPALAGFAVLYWRNGIALKEARTK